VKDKGGECETLSKTLEAIMSMESEPRSVRLPFIRVQVSPMRVILVPDPPGVVEENMTGPTYLARYASGTPPITASQAQMIEKFYAANKKLPRWAKPLFDKAWPVYPEDCYENLLPV
jgi:hypothetical protein